MSEEKQSQPLLKPTPHVLRMEAEVHAAAFFELERDIQEYGARAVGATAGQTGGLADEYVRRVRAGLGIKWGDEEILRAAAPGSIEPRKIPDAYSQPDDADLIIALNRLADAYVGLLTLADQHESFEKRWAGRKLSTPREP